jgi:hypothetical protein
MGPTCAAAGAWRQLLLLWHIWPEALHHIDHHLQDKQTHRTDPLYQQAVGTPSNMFGRLDDSNTQQKQEPLACLKSTRCIPC